MAETTSRIRKIPPSSDYCCDSNHNKKQQKSMACSYIPRLPLELERDILLRLPPEDLVRCRCVCKRWNNEINDFINSHNLPIINSNKFVNTSFTIMFSHHKTSRDLFSIDFGSLDEVKKLTYYHLPHRKSLPQLIGSCNGLLCFFCYPKNTETHRSKRFYYLYNPATRLFKLIPPLGRYFKGILQHGFGYDSVSNDYKLLCVHRFESFVYSLKTNSWKVIQPAYPNYVDIYRCIASNMVFSNNALHWTICWDKFVKKILIGFDLGSEKFHEVPLPLGQRELKQESCKWHLAVIPGCLHLVSLHISPYLQEVWIMKEYGLWTKLISNKMPLCGFPHLTLLEPYAYSEDGRELLLRVKGLAITEMTFLTFNLHSQEFKKHEFTGLPIDWRLYTSMPWVKSFVSPNSVVLDK